MTKIVGHRGIKGREHENTVRGFKLAKSLGLDAVELDVIATQDGAFVVCHDDDLKNLTGTRQFITKMNYAELAEIHLANGETIPLLYDVMALLKDIPVILDIKTDTHLPALFKIIDAYPDMDITITSWLTPWVSEEFKRQRPHIPALIERYYLPFGIMHSVRKRGADGLNLRYWWLNPLTYRALRRRGMTLQVYTIDSVWLARLIKTMYPEAWICTNRPDVLRDKL